MNFSGVRLRAPVFVLNRAEMEAHRIAADRMCGKRGGGEGAAARKGAGVSG